MYIVLYTKQGGYYSQRQFCNVEENISHSNTLLEFYKITVADHSMKMYYDAMYMYICEVAIQF